jgi:hypothetical protein
MESSARGVSRRRTLDDALVCHALHRPLDSGRSHPLFFVPAVVARV